MVNTIPSLRQPNLWDPWINANSSRASMPKIPRSLEKPAAEGIAPMRERATERATSSQRINSFFYWAQRLHIKDN